MASHTHDHVHDNSHAHTHHHHHDEEDSYYLDQLCMIGLCGAFGAICLALWFWRGDSDDSPGMLKYMLGTQFHPFVLGSGIVLVLLAVVRAAVLWVEVGHEAKGQQHHDHGHDHCGHDHDHDHAHDHHHNHEHSHHDHAHADHDHGWAPWRYMVLLVPVVLFLLGLPDKLPVAPAMDVDLERDTSIKPPPIQAAALIGLGPDASGQMTLLAGLMSKELSVDVNKAYPLEFERLLMLAQSDQERRKWDGELVQTLGQFNPSKSNPKVFTLVRYSMQCCAADRIPLYVPVFVNESIEQVKRGAWVRVVGRVSFAQRGNDYFAVLSAPGQAAVLPSSPPANPYVR